MILLLSIAAAVPEPLTIRAVASGQILMDGRCDDPVWSRARAYPLAPGSDVRLLADRRFIYACITAAAGSYATVDLYVRGGGRITQLHASAKLGERVRTSDGWPAWRWWNNVGWSANPTRFTGERGQVAFAPADGREMQIERVKFGSRFDMLLLVSDLQTTAGSVTGALPSSGRVDHPAGWVRVHLLP